MKVIVTGSTGSVGGAVLQACIQNPAVTSIYALTRRPLEVKDSKLTNIVTKNFLEYDESTLSELKGAQACIWALGTPTSGAEIHRDYVYAAVNAFQKELVPHLEKGDKFRFVLTSGAAIPILDSSLLFFLGSWRKLRADVDRGLLAHAAQNAGTWESYVVRPSLVVNENASSMIIAYIQKPELGAAMVDLAVNGLGRDDHIVVNSELKRIGNAAMSQYKL